MATIRLVPVCRILTHPAHPLVRLPSLQSQRANARPVLLSGQPSLGFHPSSRCQLAESTFAGVPPAMFRPRRFSRPRRLTPPPTFAGLFHPATTSRVRSSGCSPREKPYGLDARRCPLVVCPAPLPPVARRRQRTTPAFRAFLFSRVRDGRWLFRPPPARYPPELRPSSGSPSRAARTTFIALSDLGLSRPSSSCRHAT